VDSLGELLETKRFNSWLVGADLGYKLLDSRYISTDIFAGIAYDAMTSVIVKTSPDDYVTHGGFGASVGLRHRIFVDSRSGMYIGGLVRYSFVDYDNSRGTDLSGNTVTISVMVGWSMNETLRQFLGKLNYKGNWRKR
jgi:hypothetical protein